MASVLYFFLSIKIKINCCLSFALKTCQRAKDLPTIEEDVEEAIYKAGGIRESNHKHLDKLGWSCASRTDKGSL